MAIHQAGDMDKTFARASIGCPIIDIFFFFMFGGGQRSTDGINTDEM